MNRYLPLTSNNATPVADILKAFSLNCLIEATRFAHGRRLQDDEAGPKSLACAKVVSAARTPSAGFAGSRRRLRLKRGLLPPRK